MNTIEKHRTLVKEQLAFHLSMGEQYASNPSRAKKHKATAERFQALLEDLDTLERQGSAGSVEPPKVPRLSLRPEDIEGLPPELLEELSISSTDKTEFLIMGLVEDLGGVASLDQVLVAYYRKTGEILKRTALTSRLYRMSQKGLIYGVPNRKGVYSCQPLSELQAGELSDDATDEKGS